MSPGETSDPVLYILCGLLFSGKSTLARVMAAATGCMLVELDAIDSERGLGLAGAPITSQQWDETYREAYHRIALALIAGQSVLFDATNYTRAQRDDLRHSPRAMALQRR
jgi:predicted kinase